MSRDKYHPRQAEKDPEAYYEQAFQAYPRPNLVKCISYLIKKISKPTIIYPNSQNEDEYFSQIAEQTPIITTFSHGGKKNMHDPISAIGATVGNQYLKERISNTKTWAAIPYLTNPKYGPIIERLGAIPVIRSGDFERFGLSSNESITSALIDRSVQHLQAPNSTLDIFPAGTKGGTKLREGVGMVLEQLELATVIPIALSSDTQSTSEIPRNLRIAFGEPIFAESGMASKDYVEHIDYNLNLATVDLKNLESTTC